MSEKFSGLPYPLTKDARGYMRTQGGIQQIKSDLLILLLTNPGERVMLPEFGTGLRKLIFEPHDITLEEQARQMIINAINTWEPRISVDEIEVLANVDENSLNPFDTRDEAGGILMIRILFKDPENMQEVQELRLDVPLGGSI